MDTVFSSCVSKNKKGFAMAEVMVAIFMITMAVGVVAGLSQMVSKMSAGSKQIGSMAAFKNKFNSVSRDPSSWLNVLRGSVSTGGVFSACIPNLSSTNAPMRCPPIESISDPEIQRLSGTQLHPSSVSLVDISGEKIAGDLVDPLYLDHDGRPCSRGASVCPLKSTGYMLRSNADTASNPGNIRFVIKVEQNMIAAANDGVGRIKPEYINLDIGNSWQKSNALAGGIYFSGGGGANNNTLPGMECPKDTVHLGYLTNGKANCVHPTNTCGSGKIAMGSDSLGNAVCFDAPTDCAPGTAAMLSRDNTLVCSAETPCEYGTVFMGYAPGTGDELCVSPTEQCPNGQIQIGTEKTDSKTTPVCKSVPSCTGQQRLNFANNEFSCVNTGNVAVCPNPDDVLVGFNSDGSLSCRALDLETAITNVNNRTTRNTASNTAETAQPGDRICADGTYLAGIRADNSLICRSLATTNGDGNSDQMGSLGQYELPSWTSGSDFDRQKHILPMTCNRIGKGAVDCENVVNRFKTTNYPNNGTGVYANIVPTTSLDPESTSRKCMFVNKSWRYLTYSSETGKYFYNGYCTGGITYKKYNTPVSRLDVVPFGIPNYSTESIDAVNPRTLVKRSALGLSTGNQDAAPSRAELLAYFNSACESTSTDLHCSKLNAVLAEAMTHTTFTNSTYSAVTPNPRVNYCLFASNGAQSWQQCGIGCGVVPYLDYAPATGYRFKLRWVRNYSDGTYIPTGTPCTSLQTINNQTNVIRIAPDKPADDDDLSQTGI